MNKRVNEQVNERMNVRTKERRNEGRKELGAQYVQPCTTVQLDYGRDVEKKGTDSVNSIK